MTSGNPIKGFKWWNFTFPTLLNSGSSAVDGVHRRDQRRR